jgi:anti-sigma factor RsiW
MSMEHFSQQEWIDFARGVLHPERALAIEDHLSAGCAACLETASVWKAIAGLALQVHAAEPPEDAVATVNEAYRMARTRTPVPWLLQFAELVYDSFRSAAPVGVRSHNVQPRFSVHRTGECSVELQISDSSQAERVCLTGQVIDAKSAEGLSGARVAVMCRGTVLAETAANNFGEFTLDCGKEGELWVLVEAPKCVPFAIRAPQLSQ